MHKIREASREVIYSGMKLYGQYTFETQWAKLHALGHNWYLILA